MSKEQNAMIFNNDASASSFGWNFQANAGIYLFLHYLKEAKSIKIESKFDDIEIIMENGKKIYAQAKSVQENGSINHRMDKLKDSIISLSKDPDDAEKLLYISNYVKPIDDDSDTFKNAIIPFNEFKKEQQEQLNKIISGIIDSYTLAINKLELKQNKNKKDAKSLIKHNLEKEYLKNFAIKKFNICSIVPYFGEESRYREIRNKLLEVLGSLGISHD